jgi:hypothetical protein
MGFIATGFVVVVVVASSSSSSESESNGFVVCFLASIVEEEEDPRPTKLPVEAVVGCLTLTKGRGCKTSLRLRGLLTVRMVEAFDLFHVDALVVVVSAETPAACC